MIYSVSGESIRREMRILAAKDYMEMSQRAADIVSAQVLLKPACVLGLATGSTPLGMYARIIEEHRMGGLDFSKVSAVNLDEYKAIAPDNSQSYYYYMKENLFRHININPENTFIPNGLARNSAAECARYDTIIAGLGGIDLQVLGIGENGHIGFNEPGDSFRRETHLVTLTQNTIDANARFFDSPEEVPTHAYTMGVGAILRAKRILLVANGAKKADVLYAALYGPITPSLPASILQLHGDVTVVADPGAMSKFRL